MKGASFSIVDRVAWAQLLTMTAALGLVVSMGTLVGGVTALRREDAVSFGLGHVVSAEIAEHQADAARLEVELRAEIAEQSDMGRRIEVWRGPVRLGSDATAATLGPAARTSGRCTSERGGGERLRICTLAAPGGLQIFVAAPLDPLYQTLLAVCGAMAAMALGSLLVLRAFGRRLVGRLLRPLSTFSTRIAAMGAERTGERMPDAWGAQEIDELAAAFNALLGRIDAAMARERRFLLDASHELRSPLSRLRAQLDVLLEESGAPELRAPLQRAAAACAGLVRLTESLLALSRGEVPAGETVNLCDLARAHRAELAERQPEQAARLRVEAADEALVRADPSLVHLCLANLVDNALKFSSGPVHVEVREAGGEVLLAVEDRGPGIPAEELDRVGEPFFRGSRGTGRMPGSGLGLALVRHVAGHYGGRVTLGRPAAGGLRAEVALPAWAPVRPSAAAPEAPRLPR